MYSGTSLRDKSGHILGTHQKIDRVARKHIKKLPGAGLGFPSIREILHFEGDNGPDGIKRKSPSVDEPWHYINPEDPDDHAIVDMIMEHHANLVQALKDNNKERAAFEAAWMSHAIVDGLTPAHHYPLSDKIEELWGHPKEERLSVKQKNIIHGKTRTDTISRNWEYWGAKGVFTTHALFEFGVATASKSRTFTETLPTYEWLKDAESKGLEVVFIEAVHEVFALDMYHNYWNNGWSAKLAHQTREYLMPIIIRTVTFAWYSAIRKSGI